MNSGHKVLFFVKNPAPGQVKTRLAESIGDTEAARIYRLMTEDALAAVDASGYALEIHYTPSVAGSAVSRLLGPHRRYAAQKGADLGERMENAFRSAFATGARRAVLVGSDAPELTPSLLHDAFHSLDENGAVLAPAGDGGYTLIGFRADTFAPQIFRGPEWGGPDVLERTQGLLGDIGLKYRLLQELPDVDDLRDLESLYERSRGRPGRTAARLSARSGEFFGATLGPTENRSDKNGKSSQ